MDNFCQLFGSSLWWLLLDCRPLNLLYWRLDPICIKTQSTANPQVIHRVIHNGIQFVVILQPRQSSHFDLYCPLWICCQKCFESNNIIFDGVYGFSISQQIRGVVGGHYGKVFCLCNLAAQLRNGG